MTEPARPPHPRPADRPPSRGQRASGGSGSTSAADLMLPVVIISCLVPVGLLVIAADGGGLPTVVIAFVALVLITAALMRSIGRAIDQQPDARGVPPSAL